LTEGGAGVNDADSDGETVWSYLGTYWNEEDEDDDEDERIPPEDFIPAVQAMLARAAPPADFLQALPAVLQPLVAHGAVVRERLPLASAWRLQRDAQVVASSCGQRLPEGVVAVVMAFSALREEEVWALSSYAHLHAANALQRTAIARKDAENALQRAQIAQLLGENARQKAEIARLQAQVARHSTQSKGAEGGGPAKRQRTQ
jgi:hypothetical protein